MNFLSDAGDFDIMLFLMTIPSIRETKAKPKNDSLLDICYPWIIDRISLILPDSLEHIKNKSCVWSAEYPFLSSLPRCSKFDQRIGSSWAPTFAGPWDSEPRVPDRGWHASVLDTVPLSHSSTARTWLKNIFVPPLSRDKFSFSPFFPASHHILVLS